MVHGGEVAKGDPLGSAKSKGRGPRPSEPLKLQPSDGDGAACGAPRCGAYFGAGAVVCGSKEGDAEGVGVVRDSAPRFQGPAGGCGEAYAICGVLVNEANGGEEASAGLGAEGSLRLRRGGGGAGATPVTSAPYVANACDEELGGPPRGGPRKQCGGVACGGCCVGRCGGAVRCVWRSNGCGQRRYRLRGRWRWCKTCRLWGRERCGRGMRGRRCRRRRWPWGGAKGGALAVLDVLGKEVRVAGEALHDLTASGGAGGAFEVVDVHLDLAFELARQRKNDLVDGVH